MKDPYDVPLVDTDLLAELELCVELMIAASASPGPLSTEEIDQILGVAPGPPSRAIRRARKASGDANTPPRASAQPTDGHISRAIASSIVL
jgi:hypothetical protein